MTYLAVYLYKAKNTITNKIVKGEIELASEKLVHNYLYSKQMMPITVKEKNAMNSDISELKIFQGKLKLVDINFFCKQFAAMIHAGVSVSRALGICAAQTENKLLKRHLNNIHNNVNAGKTLSEAAREENIFPDIMVSMMECGEVSGKLDMVLNKLVEHFDNSLKIARKVKKAFTYPAIVLAALVAVVILMMIKVVPAFVSMFEDADVDLPTATKVVMAGSEFTLDNGLLLFFGTVAVVLIFTKWASTASGKRTLDSLAVNVPLIGLLNKRMITAKFANTLSMLITAGLPMLQAMEITGKVVGNYLASLEIQESISKLRTGSTLYESMLGSKIHPPLLYNMINIGEESGELDDMLTKVGIYFDEEVDNLVDQVTTFIEPIMTLILAVVVLVLIMAIVLPMFTMAQAVM